MKLLLLCLTILVGSEGFLMPLHRELSLFVNRERPRGGKIIDFHNLVGFFSVIRIFSGADHLPAFWGHVVKITPVPREPTQPLPKRYLTFKEWLQEFGRL